MNEISLSPAPNSYFVHVENWPHGYELAVKSFLVLFSELSEVLWTMVFALAIQQGVKMPIGFIVVFFLFAFWAGKTVL